MMKNIKFISLLAIVLLFAGCQKGWLDINNDPTQPTVAKVNLLLPSAEEGVASELSLGYWNLGWKCSVYVDQVSTREDLDKYGISGGDITSWDYIYAGPIPDLDKIIQLGTQNDYMQYVGVAKILKAYIYSQMVNVWGSIPFSQADSIGITSPVFDKGVAIYPSLLKMIDEGIADIQNTTSANELKPADNDLIYKGDMDKWVRAANTLKLKLYNQARLTPIFDASAVNALLTGAQLIKPGGDFMMWYGTNTNPDDRNPGESSEYSGSQISTYISPWFFETMSGLNSNVLTGIADPRIPYYWCNQVGSQPENPVEYRDGRFISIYFGSDGINRDAAGRATFTMVGFYPCGGRYDDGNFTGQLGASDAAGDAPMRFVTYPDELFMEAELALEQGVGTDARSHFEDALNASFALIDQIIKGSATTQNIPLLTGTTAVTNYITSVMAKYDAGTTAQKFQLIMTEKWIQNWGNGVDAYTDYRRTGYPVLFDANSNGGMQSGGPDGSGPVPTSCSRGYVVAFPYPNSELDLNRNAPAQRSITTDKVFWQVNNLK